MTATDTRPVRGAFRCEGEYWAITYGAATCRLRDTAGLRYLATLLRQPGWKVAATALMDARRSRLLAVPQAADDASSLRSASEGARVAVTRSIRAAMLRIAAHNPELSEHLNATIRTGTHCLYAPDARRLVAWEFDLR